MAEVPIHLNGPYQPVYAAGEDLPEFARIDPGFETVVGFIEPSLTEIIKQLKPNLEDGKYNLLICEGNSALIPASIIHGVASEIYESKGYKPLTTFMTKAGSQKDDDALYEEITHGVANEILQPGMSALIVTDCIDTGACVGRLVSGLNTSGIRSDVTALSFWKDEAEVRNANPGITDSTQLYLGQKYFRPSTCRSDFLTPPTVFDPSPAIWNSPFVVSLKDATSRDINRMVTKLSS